VRVVLDPNVIISALLSSTGAPAEILRSWSAGAFELIVSPQLRAELERALAYPKLRSRVTAHDAERFLRWLERSATQTRDPGEAASIRSPDPGDDYLLALAANERAALVSGDGHLLSLAAEVPIFSPRDFLAFLADRSNVDS